MVSWTRRDLEFFTELQKVREANIRDEKRRDHAEGADIVEARYHKRRKQIACFQCIAWPSHKSKSIWETRREQLIRLCSGRHKHASNITWEPLLTTRISRLLQPIILIITRCFLAIFFKLPWKNIVAFLITRSKAKRASNVSFRHTCYEITVIKDGCISCR